MKRKIILAFSAIAVLIMAASWLIPSEKPVINKVEYSFTSSAIPDSLNTVFENSCTECHSQGGSPLAMSKLNFSEWDSYNAKKQAQKAHAIYSEVSEEKMPPKKFRKEHPELIPTPEQIESIRTWSRKLNSEL